MKGKNSRISFHSSNRTKLFIFHLTKRKKKIFTLVRGSSVPLFFSALSTSTGLKCRHMLIVHVPLLFQAHVQSVT